MPLDHKKLHDLILASKLSQAEVARRAGMSNPVLSRFVAGNRKNPSLESVERLAAAMDVPIIALLTTVQKKKH